MGDGPLETSSAVTRPAEGPWTSAQRSSLPPTLPQRPHTHLTHNGVLGVTGLHDGRLHKVAFTVVAGSSGQNLQTGGRPGVLQPPPGPGERLRPHRDGETRRDHLKTTSHLVIDDR